MKSPDIPDLEPATPRRRSGLIGAGIGVAALIASLLAFSTLAGAQDSGPELVEEDPALAEAEDDGVDESSDDADADEFLPYEMCFEDLFGQFGLDLDGEDDAEFDEGFDEEAFDEAATACDDLLPQSAKDEIAKFDEAFEAFDACLSDAGVGFADELDGVFEGEFPDGFDGELPFDMGTVVSVMSGDSLSIAEFGDGDGTVTITKTGDDIAVSSTGDVAIEDIDFDLEGMELDEDFEAFDEAFSICEESLPEDLLDGEFFFEDGFFDDFDWDDDEDDDEPEEAEGDEPEDADLS